MNPERPKLSVKTGATRDPRRRSVRPGAPRAPAAKTPAVGPAEPQARPPRPARSVDLPPRTDRDAPRDRPARPFDAPGGKPSGPPRGGRDARPVERSPGPGSSPPRGGRDARPVDRSAGPSAKRPHDAPVDRASGRPSDRPFVKPSARTPFKPARPDDVRAPASEDTVRPPRVERAAAPIAASAPRIARDPGTEGIRLSKQLSDSGQASRREADDWIAAGWVRVDGKLAVLGQRVLPHQRIDIDPAARGFQSQQVTIIINKPIGFVSGQAEDGHEPAVVLVTQANHWTADPSRLRLNPGHLRGLAPAGRLDIDSTGMLVMTQDGRIARHLIGEDSHVEKEYLVRIEPVADGSVVENAIALLNHGLELDGQPLKPAKVSWQNEEQLRFVLREGKKRQIRRMCELVGYKVTGLKRIRIGSVVLGQLPPGQWRFLGLYERF